MREDLVQTNGRVELEAALGRYLADALEELFRAYGAWSPERCDVPVPTRGTARAASIGFSAASASGTVTLTVEEDLLYASLSSIGGDDAPRMMLTDWAGELANQLLGRLKSKLLGHQLILEMSTPHGSVSPLPPQPLIVADAHAEVLFVACDGRQAQATMTMCFGPAFVWVDVIEASLGCVCEGEFTFF